VSPAEIAWRRERLADRLMMGFGEMRQLHAPACTTGLEAPNAARLLDQSLDARYHRRLHKHELSAIASPGQGKDLPWPSIRAVPLSVAIPTTVAFPREIGTY